MASRFSLALALLLALALWPYTAEAATRQPCAAKGSRTLAASERARVFKWKAESATTYHVYGCHYRRNRRYRLDYHRVDDEDPYPPRSEVKLITLSARYVAWVNDWSDRVGGTTTVNVVNLRTGATKHSWSRGSNQHAVSNPEWETEQRHFYSISDLVLKPGGAVAWIASSQVRDPFQESEYTVYKSDATGEGVMLDSGAGLDLDSLALSDATLYWMKDGQPQAAPLY